MSNLAHQHFMLGEWHVDPEVGLLRSGEKQVSIRPREMDLLVYLAQQAGKVVATDNIMENVWKGVFVANDSVYFSVSQLRKALGDDSQDPTYIATIPKRGYQLLAPVQFIEDLAGSDAPVSGTLRQRRISLASATTWGASIVFAAGLIAWLALGALQTAPASSTNDINLRSIAVMPFVDLSPDHDQEYFSSGIAEELLNRLARIKSLSVAARTSSFSFKGKEPNIAEIREALAVATILEGSVRKEGDRVRIAVQLVDTQSGFLLWSDSYERDISSIFAVQEEIGQAVAEALQIELVGQPSIDQQGMRRLTNPVVYEHYLKGVDASRRNSYEALAKAVEQLETVIRLDPSFSQAYDALARARYHQLATGAIADQDVLGEVEDLAHKALEIDPYIGSPHVTLGYVFQRWGRRDDSQREYALALNLSPNDSNAMVALARTYNTSEQRVEAARLFQQALRIDPFNPEVHIQYGHYLQEIGKTRQALLAFERAAERNLQNPNYHWMIGYQKLAEMGLVAAGIDHMLEAARLDPDDYEIQAYLAMAYLALDAADLAKPYVDRAVAIRQASSVVNAAQALYYLATDRHDEAMQLSISTLRDDRTLYSHGTENLLIRIAVNELLERGDIETAEELVSRGKLAYSPSFMHGCDLEVLQDGVAREWVLARANVRKSAGRAVALAADLELLQSVGLASQMNLREELRNRDYLTEAEISALAGDKDRALEMLERAVDEGARFNWQLTIASNYSFVGLRGQDRFQVLLDRIKSDMKFQSALVVAN